MATAIRLATYNIGDFSGKNLKHGTPEAMEAFHEVMQRAHAALWALQEDAEFACEEQKIGPNEGVYRTYKHYERRFSGRYNGKAFLSDLPIRDVDQVFYTCSKERVGHRWFLRATVELGGYDVCLINVHLDWGDNFTRHEQIAQVIAYAKQYEYAIIMGDFNPDDFKDWEKQSTRNLMEEEVKFFTDAGFIPANAGAFGVIPTFIHGGAAIDNILVSGNMRIVAADHITMDWCNDHMPLWADIEIE